jgi:peptidoglycan/LPS O-acetylase OafA/YrhL
MNEIPPRNSMRAYRPDIDGVRAVAVIAVVLYHAGTPLISGGFTGVDIFFVISGYLIGGRILAEISTGTFSFLRFYQRRAKRILPAFFLVIAFTFLAAMVLLSPFEAYIFAKSAIASLLSISNIYFGVNANYFQTANELKPLLMTWSLGIEEQFYAVIPILMILLARIRRSLLLPTIISMCAISFLFTWTYLKSSPSMAFYSLPARVWELGTGVALAAFELSPKRTQLSPRWSQIISLAGLAFMLAPVFLFTSATPFPGAYALPSVFGTAMVIASPASWVNSKLLPLSPLVFVGTISYSWYLWHWPMLAFLRIASAGTLPSIAAAVAVFLSFVAAVLSYYLVEQPYRRSTRAPVSLLIRYALVSLVFLAACLTLRLGHGFPKRYPELVHDGDTIADPCVADYGTDRPQLSSQCDATSDDRPAVALWGDSHSSVLAETLRKIANTEGYSFVQFSKSSCLPLQGAALFIREHPLVASECIRFNTEVLGLLASDRRIRIVIMTGRWAAPFHDHDIVPLVTSNLHESNTQYPDVIRNTFVESLSASILPLRNAGRHVIVLDDVPNFDFDPLLRYRTARIPARHTLAVWMRAGADDKGLAPAAFTSAAKTTTTLFDHTFERLSGVEIVELKSVLCNSHNLCAYMDGNQLLYADQHHVTTEGAQYVLRDFHFPSL